MPHFNLPSKLRIAMGKLGPLLKHLRCELEKALNPLLSYLFLLGPFSHLSIHSISFVFGIRFKGVP
ncbi:hypothetical protein AKJ45_02430 [candidate division MSBL1 archaeon SCGC-AAA261F19]|uniref:Uncharacterized protein n=2 Tax=candidate division MSBL1 TaxID=215777 RepID=A0A133V9L5_9EURY|nr:hypothetical protein AKJ43_01330 [candidate division MSBL1 archaeon SCGC-AAA261D19]KXB03143.1 hypothetical protein AKJ45_02430 [candidate division MSBL1 archaeon SCGC-AAA261F19]